YTAGAIWCLALHHLVRQRAVLEHKIPELESTTLFARQGAATALPWRRFGLGQAVRWSACIIVLGFGLFLAAPRQSNATWQADRLSNGTLSVGIGIENSINLANTGSLFLTDDVAFEVSAQSLDGPMQNLSPNTLYLVDVLDYYDQGQWLNWYFAMRTRERTWSFSPNPIRAPFAPHPHDSTLPKTLT